MSSFPTIIKDLGFKPSSGIIVYGGYNPDAHSYLLVEGMGNESDGSDIYIVRTLVHHAGDFYLVPSDLSSWSDLGDFIPDMHNYEVVSYEKYTPQYISKELLDEIF